MDSLKEILLDQPDYVILHKGTITWMDEGGAVDVVYLGFSKAFSTVSQYPHRRDVGVGWVHSGVDWELIEWTIPEGHNQ